MTALRTKPDTGTAQGPYAIFPSGDFWVLRDNRTGNLASFPTSKAKARAEAKFMNEQYAKVMAEVAAEQSGASS